VGGGQGGGEAVGVGEGGLRTKFGCGGGQVEVGGDFDGELGEVFDDFSGCAGAFAAPGGVIDFAPGKSIG